MNESIPIIRLEVSRMKQTIIAALTQHSMQMDTALIEAINRYCTDENINAIVYQEAKSAINAAVKQEVRDFFQWSRPGRQAIKEAVQKHMNEWATRSFGEDA